MARKLERLSARRVAAEKRPGLYPDGGNLYMQVGDGGNKSWIMRYTLNGRARYHGLGAVHTVTLGEAREKARAARKLLEEGHDPIDARDAHRRQAAIDAAKSVTFRQAAEAYIKSHRAGWKNIKHAQQWENTLSTYAYPVLGALPVAAIDTGFVIRVLETIWQEKPETASRLRGRIESVLDLARVRGYREGENPARWRGHLDHLLPARRKVRAVEHHSALPYREVPAFMAELRAQDGLGARALEFAILTAARTGEVIGASPMEFDVRRAVWTIPAARMKAKREHRVPLSPRALEIAQDCECEFRLSNMAMLMLLRRMKHADLTVHGFRSTFRDWAAEQANAPQELAEMALAHIISNKTEAAYRRGDLFEKRRELMDGWGRFCNE